MADFTATEQSKILRYLGYTDWTNLAASFQLGFPADSQPEFLIRRAFDLITDEGKELVRRDLRELECIENQMSDSRSRLKAEKIGDMTLNPKEFNQLRQQLIYWTGKLADDLGGYPNPFGSQAAMGVGGRNARVMH
jgi:hypothetical protein